MASQPTARTWKHWTEPSWVEVDGLNTAYRRKGSGETLLFLHGAGNTRQWLPFHEELSKSFDVIVPEHPGFGDTEMPEWLDNFDDYVLHYDGFLRALDIERPHLVGHSVGGWTAAELAVFYPERFASIALLCPMGMRVEGEPAADPFRWSPEQANQAILNGLGERYSEYLQQDPDEIEQTIFEYGQAVTFTRLTWNPRYDYRLERRLARVAAPTTVIHPADDNFIPLSHSTKYAELIPGAHLEILQGADGEPATHDVVLQQPKQLAKLIADRALATA
jgi:pimeloyl-ACP methyl ester carboxylesterase